MTKRPAPKTWFPKWLPFQWMMGLIATGALVRFGELMIEWLFALL